jgi:hypothetical protein
MLNTNLLLKLKCSQQSSDPNTWLTATVIPDTRIPGPLLHTAAIPFVRWKMITMYVQVQFLRDRLLVVRYLVWVKGLLF